MTENNGVQIEPNLVNRRELAQISSTIASIVLTTSTTVPAKSEEVPAVAPLVPSKASLRRVRDSNTYEALVYAPSTNGKKEKLPLLLVLHGAGKNDQTALDLADMNGEHAGLAPSLLASQQAPETLSKNFCVVAPYVGDGKRSFYEEPRSKVLAFLDWVLSEEGQAAGCPQNVDKARICLFGFSDGATVAVELATTQRFRCVVVAAYGFTGTLPQLALDRLGSVPMWVFHSADDVIFPVRCSDQLVASLRGENPQDARPENGMVRYTRYTHDPEGCTGSVRGHCVGITASKNPDVYSWMLSV